MDPVLVPLAHGFEEMEAVVPIDCLRRAGLKVLTASVAGPLAVRGKTGMEFTAEVSLADCLEDAFSAILLPGGPGHVHLMEATGLLHRLKRQSSENRLLAAICAAPKVLQAAGLLEGKRFTAHPTTDAALPGRIVGEAVVIDGNIITSQGAGTSFAFAMAIIENLLDRATAERVAAEICLA
jgi:4-methyl-5(b-hydroxyethyl)-thiazole monophosphate biosynthesis